MSGLMADTRRECPSVPQLDLLITFMEAYSSFAIGLLRLMKDRAHSTRMWDQCANILNSEGVAKKPKDWLKFWKKYKCRVRTKQAKINRAYRGTEGGPSRAPQLSPLEERVAALIRRDIVPLSGVRQDPAIKIEHHNAEEMEVEQDVQLPAANSPSLELSAIPENTGAPVNRSPAAQDLSQSVTLKSEQIESARVEGYDQPADQDTTATDRPRLRRPRPTRSRAAGRPRLLYQRNSAALDEAEATISRIEEMYTRTEEMLATTALNMSNAMTSISNAMTRITESLRTNVSSSHSTDD